MKKNLLVFGANSFIAKEFMREYGSGYQLYPVYREVSGAAENTLPPLDFNDPAAIASFAAAVSFQIDGILFLQGINPSKGVADIDEAHFLRMMRVNLVTPVMLLAALKHRLNPGAMILLVSSVAKRKGSYDPSYAAAKSGLTGLMFSLANGYPAQRFNMISLGLVEGSPVFNGMTEDFRARHAARMKDGAFVKPADVTSVIRLLLANESINTTDVAIDGGYS